MYTKKIKKVLNLLPYLINLIFILLVFYSILNIFQENLKYTKDVEIFRNNNIYIVSDKTNNHHIDYLMKNENNSLKTAKELASLIYNNNNLKVYTHFYYYRFEVSSDGNNIKHYYVNKNFHDLSNLNIIYGENFYSSNFNNSSDIIPIIIGHDLANIYSLNKVYSLPDPITGKYLDYKVIGILEENSQYISANYDMYENLDYSIIQPLIINNISEINEFSQLDLFINRSFIQTDNYSFLKEIEQKSVDLNLFSISYITADDSINNIIEIINKKLSLPFIIFFLLLTLLIFNIKKIYNKNIFKKNVFIRINFIFLSASLIIVLYLYSWISIQKGVLK